MNAEREISKFLDYRNGILTTTVVLKSHWFYALLECHHKLCEYNAAYFPMDLWIRSGKCLLMVNHSMIACNCSRTFAVQFKFQEGCQNNRFSTKIKTKFILILYKLWNGRLHEKIEWNCMKVNNCTQPLSAALSEITCEVIETKYPNILYPVSAQK